MFKIAGAKKVFLKMILSYKKSFVLLNYGREIKLSFIVLSLYPCKLRNCINYEYFEFRGIVGVFLPSPSDLPGLTISLKHSSPKIMKK